KAWPVRSAQCRPPSPPPPASPPASKAAPRRADRRPSPSAGSPARPRNTTEKPSSPSPPRQPRPLPSSTHPPPESEDHDRFSSSSICHANFQSIALLAEPDAVVDCDCGDYDGSAGSANRFLLERSGSFLSVVPLPDFAETEDPIALFRLWLQEAGAAEVNDPEAMALATVDENGLPDVRMLLCKGVNARGLVFYGNVESAKGHELEAHPKAAALFHWKSLRRQARFRGPVSPLTEAEADSYFATRPRQSRIGAWASQQSRPLES